MKVYVANRVLVALLSAGVSGILGGIFFTPSLINQYLSADGILKRATIDRIQDLQFYSIVFGNLTVFAAVTVCVFENWQRGNTRA